MLIEFKMRNKIVSKWVSIFMNRLLPVEKRNRLKNPAATGFFNRLLLILIPFYSPIGRQLSCYVVGKYWFLIFLVSSINDSVLFDDALFICSEL